jgi:cell wall-associated NlpC family hydrolase
MTPNTGERYVVAMGVADIRRSPDPSSELVTQALLNNPVLAGAVDGEWTHVHLTDYAGWIRTDQVVKGGETCRAPLSLLAVITSTHTPLYIDEEGDGTLGMAYLSSALPLLDASTAGRVRVALPGERSAWLQRGQVALRQRENLYPQAPLQAITAHALSFVRRPYLWGGTSWEGIDCSGFVQLCYRMGGYMLPRDADQQHDFLVCSVKREDLRAGDLIFFGSKEITHVAMALNGREYIHAEGQNYNYVVVNSFDRAARHYYQRLDEIVWAIKRVVV